VTRNEQLRLIVELACLTEDRTNSEEAALIAWAWDCDREHNRIVSTNRAFYEDPKWEPWDLVSLVIESRHPDHPRGRLPKRWAEQWATWRREWPEARP